MAEAEAERITGAHAGPGVVCPQFRLADGETVSLSGDTASVAAAGTVTLRGRWMTRTKCMQGREFRVEGVEE